MFMPQQRFKPIRRWRGAFQSASGLETDYVAVKFRAPRHQPMTFDIVTSYEDFLPLNRRQRWEMFCHSDRRSR